MKRTFCLLLALVICFSAAVTVRADLIFQPDDSFYWDYQEECDYHDRYYFAQGPDGVTVYESPRSAAVDAQVENGTLMWVGYIYTDEDGVRWGYTEQFNGLWQGWVPMDYLLLKYDHLSFDEEFADRIEEASGTVTAEEGEIYFWNYPGSADQVSVPVDKDYLPEYSRIFTDDAGRQWGYVSYHMGIKRVWICLDTPTADYDTLYAELDPQQVTHPVMADIADLNEIKPGGFRLGGVLMAAGAVAAASAVFLWLTRKKK